VGFFFSKVLDLGPCTCQLALNTISERIGADVWIYFVADGHEVRILARSESKALERFPGECYMSDDHHHVVVFLNLTGM